MKLSTMKGKTSKGFRFGYTTMEKAVDSVKGPTLSWVNLHIAYIFCEGFAFPVSRKVKNDIR